MAKLRRIKRRIVTSKRKKVSLANVCKNIPFWGSNTGNVMVILDPVIGTPSSNIPLNKRQLEFTKNVLQKFGIKKNDLMFISSAPPVDAQTWKRDKALGDHLKEHRDELLKAIDAYKPKFIIAMGKTAARQVMGRSVQITKVRGLSYFDEERKCTVLPSLGLLHVMTRPETIDIFEADMATASRIIANNYVSNYEADIEVNYRWVKDLRPFMRKKPSFLSVDCETVGLRAYDPTSRVLTVQISWEPGKGIAIPIDYNPFDENGDPYTEENADQWEPNRPVDPKLRAKLIRQLKKWLSDPSVRIIGHNFKFDWQMLMRRLGICVPNYYDDTILMTHAVDENMLSKSLDDCVRRWVPAMSGYADEFNKDPIHLQKTRMDLVPPHKMLNYGGGDSDAALRLHGVLRETLKQDKKAYNCYRRVPMPAMRTFAEIENTGFKVDLKALDAFRTKLRKHQEAEEKALWKEIPKSIQNKHKDGGLKLSRDVILRDFLFLHKDGLRLKPRVFTDSTAELEDKSKRVPSVSTKKHLPYFDHIPVVKRLMSYIKNQKMLTTYVGSSYDEEKGGPTGLYQYILDGYIRPSYLMHGAVTGRTASRDPNGQNFPKRGDFAKDYRRIFVAPPGYALLEVDFSQIELRVAAILSGDKEMLRIYREGGDIHEATAAAVMGIDIEEFRELDEDTRKLKRFQAKAVNFGFIYGMGWRGFMTYAKTDYGIDFTEEEAQEIRNAYFKKYKGLQPWHRKVKEFVEKHGYVRALDGRVRHLPNVYSYDEAIVAMAVRQAVNSPVQGFANDLGLMAAARMFNEADPREVRQIGFIHDAIVCLVPLEIAANGARTVAQFMESNPLEKWFGFKSPIPLPAEPSVGLNLASMYEIPHSDLEDDKVVSWDHLVAKMKDGDKEKFAGVVKAKRKRRRLSPKKLKRAA